MSTVAYVTCEIGELNQLELGPLAREHGVAGLALPADGVVGAGRLLDLGYVDLATAAAEATPGLQTVVLPADCSPTSDGRDRLAADYLNRTLPSNEPRVQVVAPPKAGEADLPFERRRVEVLTRAARALHIGVAELAVVTTSVEDLQLARTSGVAMAILTRRHRAETWSDRFQTAAEAADRLANGVPVILPRGLHRVYPETYR